MSKFCISWDYEMIDLQLEKTDTCLSGNNQRKDKNFASNFVLWRLLNYVSVSRHCWQSATSTANLSNHTADSQASWSSTAWKNSPVYLQPGLDYTALSSLRRPHPGVFVIPRGKDLFHTLMPLCSGFLREVMHVLWYVYYPYNKPPQFNEQFFHSHSVFLESCWV